MAPLSEADVHDVNTRYHDVAAAGYDFKWGIGFDAAAQRQVIAKVSKALGGAPGHFGRALEVGAGTGYLSLNLLEAGVVDSAVCTDISPGMLAALEANAERLGQSVEAVVAAAEELPFPEESFDVVFGHAVLHHLPDLPRALREFRRVLRPGGLVLFAGEPSRVGDRLAWVPKHGAHAVSPLWRRLMRAAPAGVHVHEQPHAADAHGLEHLVDQHAFSPSELERLASGAGLTAVQVRGEELLANWFGWTNRTLEASAAPEDVPWLWRQYAYRGYLLLQQVDRRLLEGRLPPGLFYNLMLTAERPATS